MADNDATYVLATTRASALRGAAPKPLKVDILAENINLFLSQMDGILGKAPDSVGEFRFAEFEVRAEISAKGQLVLLGAGGEAGATGGLSFTFKRLRASSES